MSTPPGRFRFGLRTLFVVVTVVCIWLGYSVNWIRQRHEFLNLSDVSGRESPAGSRTPAPWPLWMFGEPGIFEIDVPKRYESEARELFPEVRAINGLI